MSSVQYDCRCSTDVPYSPVTLDWYIKRISFTILPTETQTISISHMNEIIKPLWKYVTSPCPLTKCVLLDNMKDRLIWWPHRRFSSEDIKYHSELSRVTVGSSRIYANVICETTTEFQLHWLSRKSPPRLLLIKTLQSLSTIPAGEQGIRAPLGSFREGVYLKSWPAGMTRWCISFYGLVGPGWRILADKWIVVGIELPFTSLPHNHYTNLTLMHSAYINLTLNRWEVHAEVLGRREMWW